MFVHGHKVDLTQCQALHTFDGTVTSEKLNKMLLEVSSLNVCVGHPEKQFLDVCNMRKGHIKGKMGDIVAYRDDNYPLSLNGEIYHSTVRTASCELLVKDTKCAACKRYRSVLRSLHNRSTKCNSEKSSGPSSHTNYRYLKTPERVKRISRLKSKLDQSKRETAHLKTKIEQLQKCQTVHVDEPLVADLKAIMEEKINEIHKSHPPGSFLRLFWDQQLQAIKTTDHRQLRWHPMIVKWCLNLKHISSAAYNALRNTLVLPSDRTLRDYTHYIDSRAGFDDNVDKQLMKEANVDNVPECLKYVCLVLDEVRIKEDLVYDKYSMQVIGFVNVGDINDQLLRFEQVQATESQLPLPTPSVAKHMLVFMVRGIFSGLEFPYVQFPSSSLSGDIIFPLVWECIKRLEACNLKVIAITADGASSNRKFFRMHKQASNGDEDIVYKTVNVYSPDNRPLFFISDVPHLVKTVRNCWSNSFGHSFTRNLMVSLYIYSHIHPQCLHIKVMSTYRSMDKPFLGNIFNISTTTIREMERGRHLVYQ